LTAPGERLRRLGILLTALLGVGVFLSVMNGHYAIERWLFWIYAEIWICVLGFGAACLCAGDLVVTRLVGWRAPPRERLLVSFAVGVLVFQTGVFVVGLFHGLGTVFFVAWPALLIALRAVPLVRLGLRLHRLTAPPQLTWPGGLALLFGLGGLCLVYVNILTPANVAFDSRWYHLALAEHYVAAGAITRFPEGWFNGSLPHLASLLYTWAFLIPNGGLFARIELAAHVELVVFLVTLGGVSLLARWCAALAGIRVQHGWAAVFLFPGILLYDSSLSGAADHVLAFWAPFIFLLLRRTLRDWDWRSALLLGLLVAGAVSTKYQAAYLCAAPGLALLWCAGRVVRGWDPGAPAGQGILGAGTTATTTPGRPSRSLGARLAAAGLPLGACGAALVVATTPLWLRNWIWYGDPVYPMLPRVFSPRPWVPGTDPDRFLQLSSWTPQGTLAEKIKETLLATVQFSFKPHDWWNLHADLPVFGSLFTLGLPLILFLAPRRRLLALGGSTWLGLCVWYWTYHQDRYLQALVPWMAAFLAAVLAMTWRRGLAGRAAVVALVAAQIIWGGDIFAIPTHAMIGQQPAKLVLDLISAGYRADWPTQRESHQDLVPVGRMLPPNSKVLVHERLIHLGLEAMSVADAPGTQGGISYGTLDNPRRVHELLRSFGVTHLLWRPGTTLGWQTVADDLVFFDFVAHHVDKVADLVGLTLATLPGAPPAPVMEPRLVRVLTCDFAATVPLRAVDAVLAGARALPPVAPDRVPEFFVIQTGCASGVGMPPESRPRYRLAASRPPYELWISAAPDR
jgi:hypothetical protein